MSDVETLSARISTERTPLEGAPIATRSDQAWRPSSPTLSATPPPRGRRRLRLSSQSRPASSPLGGSRLSGAAGVAGCGDAGTAEDPADGGPPGNGGVAPAVRFEAIPVASGRALSPVETVT